MRKAQLLKAVEGLPYKVGDFLHVYEGRYGWVWHVYKTIIQIPDDAIKIEEGK